MNFSVPLPVIVFEFLAFLFALSVHEAAHALVANWRGDPTARLLGRITLNPLPHMEMFGTIIFPILGLLGGGLMFGWAKPTPVDRRHFRNPRLDDILVTLAGPASNLLLAIVFTLVTVGLGGLAAAQGAAGHQAALLHPNIVQAQSLFGLGTVGALRTFAWISVEMNVILFIFNLIPLPPLDGSHILRNLLPAQWSSAYNYLYRNMMVSFILLLGLIYWGVPNRLIDPVIEVFRRIALV